jgi:hypothetical protein
MHGCKWKLRARSLLSRYAFINSPVGLRKEIGESSVQVTNWEVRSRVARLFFYAFAKIARDHLSHESKVHLIIAYADAAGKFKSNLTVPNLLNNDGIKKILLEYVASISKAPEIDEASKSTSGRVNEFIATKYNFTEPYITKITADQMKQYFVMLQKETELALHAA